MLTREENERLCRVNPGTPMGAMLREYWWPVLRSAALVADGRPIRVRLLGENFVAFRDTSGRVGVLDEACPHRGVSLALGRNEDCGLRCIMHGWKLDVNGSVVDTMTGPELARPDRIPIASYPAREAGGMLWMWPGLGDPPPFPAFPFNELPDGIQVNAVVGLMHCNWVQPMETLWDPVHVGVLHSQGANMRRQWEGTDYGAGRGPDSDTAAMPSGPDFECLSEPYGFRYRFARDAMGPNWVATVMPCWLFAPGKMGPADDADRIVFGHVPVDDDNMLLWQIMYNTEHEIGPIGRRVHEAVIDPDNFRIPGMTAENDWGQDREAMASLDSWSGIGYGRGIAGVQFEDFAVAESMGPIVDRTKERLTRIDMAVIKGRRVLLDALTAYEAGEKALGVDFDVSTVGRPGGVEYAEPATV